MTKSFLFPPTTTTQIQLVQGVVSHHVMHEQSSSFFVSVNTEHDSEHCPLLLKSEVKTANRRFMIIFFTLISVTFYKFCKFSQIRFGCQFQRAIMKRKSHISIKSNSIAWTCCMKEMSQMMAQPTQSLGNLYINARSVANKQEKLKKKTLKKAFNDQQYRTSVNYTCCCIRKGHHVHA